MTTPAVNPLTGAPVNIIDPVTGKLSVVDVNGNLQVSTPPGSSLNENLAQVGGTNVQTATTGSAFTAGGTQGVEIGLANTAPSINPLFGGSLGDGNNGTNAAAQHPYLYNGATFDRQRTPHKFIPIASTAIGSETTIWTPTSGKKFRLMGFLLSVSAAVSIVLKDGTGGTTIFQIPTSAVNADIVPVNLGNGILSAMADNVLTATSSGAANLTGTVWGTEE